MIWEILSELAQTVGIACAVFLALRVDWKARRGDFDGEPGPPGIPGPPGPAGRDAGSH